MVLDFIHLSNGRIIDPLNGVNDVSGDLWVREGKIVAVPEIPPKSCLRIDLQGRVVMPGGVDLHSHVAGPKVNVARRMQSQGSLRFGEDLHGSAVKDACRTEQKSRLQTDKGKTNISPLCNASRPALSCVPDIITTGRRYCGLGYTTCFDAAITPIASAMVRHELRDLPNLDAGLFVLVGNNHFAMQTIARHDRRALRSFLAWLLKRCGAYALKLVNPGGVEMWKQRAGGNARDLDQPINGFGVTPRQIVSEIAAAANELQLPHPVHIHCNNLGVPGNYSTTLQTMQMCQGLRAHFAHVQFHSYGGGDQESKLCSKVQPLAEFINQHPQLSVDVGQVMFAKTTTMTADGPLGYYLHTLGNRRWYSADVELESGCGISPIRYRQKNFVHALQWAIGLEWFLSVDNPWQLALTTDHPNGACFLAYPTIIRLLMDSAFRRQCIGQIHTGVLRHSGLADMNREYSLYEIAIITRAAPAKILGLSNKGHLGIGADADITVYNPDPNYETMFSWPQMVIKAGQVLIENGEFRQFVRGDLLCVQPDYDREQGVAIEKWFDDNYSIPWSAID